MVAMAAWILVSRRDLRPWRGTPRAAGCKRNAAASRDHHGRLAGGSRGRGVPAPRGRRRGRVRALTAPLDGPRRGHRPAPGRAAGARSRSRGDQRPGRRAALPRRARRDRQRTAVRVPVHLLRGAAPPDARGSRGRRLPPRRRGARLRPGRRGRRRPDRRTGIRTRPRPDLRRRHPFQRPAQARPRGRAGLRRLRRLARHGGRARAERGGVLDLRGRHHLLRPAQQPHPGVPDPEPGGLPGGGRAPGQLGLVSQRRRARPRPPAGRPRRRPARRLGGGRRRARGGARCAVSRRRGGAAAPALRAGDQEPRALRPGGVRHRGRAHGVRAHRPHRRRRVRAATARGRRHRQGRGGRPHARRGDRRLQRRPPGRPAPVGDRAGLPGEVGHAARPRSRCAIPVRKQLAGRRPASVRPPRGRRQPARAERVRREPDEENRPMSSPTTKGPTSEVRDGMQIDWDVPIPVDDGLVLRADVYRPLGDGRYPVILSYGPYAKGLAFQEGYPSAWTRMVEQHPDVAAGSTNKYQNWEVVDPEKWVPDGYACVRVDSRGCGRSPGVIDHFSPRETKDFAACIEWAGEQPWSNGKVGLNGISYYGMNQWQVAGEQPRHLAAMCVWEGASDWYRDATHHGGILSTFWANWYDMQVKTVQYGLGERGPVNPNTGQLVCGDETLEESQLAANRADFGAEILAHPLDDDYHRERSGAWDRLNVPLLSAGNWGGQGLHLRGNVEGFLRAVTEDKWLEMHGIEHWTHFYTDYGVA